SEH
ncbi:hypothetical protein CLOM_g4154, partial [Closterium sp. NIES-68]